MSGPIPPSRTACIQIQLSYQRSNIGWVFGLVVSKYGIAWLANHSKERTHRHHHSNRTFLKYAFPFSVIRSLSLSPIILASISPTPFSRSSPSFMAAGGGDGVCGQPFEKPSLMGSGVWLCAHTLLAGAPAIKLCERLVTSGHKITRKKVP